MSFGTLKFTSLVDRRPISLSGLRLWAYSRTVFRGPPMWRVPMSGVFVGGVFVVWVFVGEDVVEWRFSMSVIIILAILLAISSALSRLVH